MDYNEILDFGDDPTNSVDEKLAILKFEYSWAEAMEEHDRKMEEAADILKHADVCNGEASEDKRNIYGDRFIAILQPSKENQIEPTINQTPQEWQLDIKRELESEDSNGQITIEEKDRCIVKQEESVVSTDDARKKQTEKVEDEEGLLSKFEELLQKLEGDMPMEEVWKQERDFQEDGGIEMANINSMSVDGMLVDIGDSQETRSNRLEKVTQEEKKQKKERHQDANFAKKLRAQLLERRIKRKRRRVKRSNKIKDENFKNQDKPIVEEELRTGAVCIEKDDTGQHINGELSSSDEENDCKLEGQFQLEEKNAKNKECEEDKEEKKETVNGLPKEESAPRMTMDQEKYFKETENLINGDDRGMTFQIDHGCRTHEIEEETSVVDKDKKHRPERIDKRNIKEEAAAYLKHADVFNDEASEEKRKISGDQSTGILQQSQEYQIHTTTNQNPLECQLEIKRELESVNSNRQITLNEKDRCILKKEESVASTKDVNKTQTEKEEDEEGLLTKFEELLLKLEGDMPMEEVWKQQRDFQEDGGTQMANINSLSVDRMLAKKIPTFKDGGQKPFEPLNKTSKKERKNQQKSAKGMAKLSVKEETTIQSENIGDGLESQPSKLEKVTQEEKKQKEGRRQDANQVIKLRAQLLERRIKRKRRRVKRSDNEIKDKSCKNQCKPIVEEEFRTGGPCKEKEDTSKHFNGEVSPLQREEIECKLEGNTLLEEKITKNKECEEEKEETKERVYGLPKEESPPSKTINQEKCFKEKENLINEEDRRGQTDHGYKTGEDEDATNVVEKDIKHQTVGRDENIIKEVKLDGFVSPITAKLTKVVNDDDDDDDAGFMPRRLFFFSFSQFKDEERTN